MIREFYKSVFENMDPPRPRTRQEALNYTLAAFMAVYKQRTHLTPEEAIRIIAEEMSHDQAPVLGRKDAVRQILEEAKQKP